ncbi:hypothetical protein FVE85_4953 [Porphyridium purpureum]|uniref:ARID domain-containing protein n=1 Tax=Porphyridium purpureum TaxID=35688 RepID=A0A5J4YR96_PORPP|nr:hypothetical protein FVE85_4953 [Porphyridium purpureum]|eukprot:POR1597..scf236_6
MQGTGACPEELREGMQPQELGWSASVNRMEWMCALVAYLERIGERDAAHRVRVNVSIRGKRAGFEIQDVLPELFVVVVMQMGGYDSICRAYYTCDGRANEQAPDNKDPHRLWRVVRDALPVAVNAACTTACIESLYETYLLAYEREHLALARGIGAHVSAAAVHPRELPGHQICVRLVSQPQQQRPHMQMQMQAQTQGHPHGGSRPSVKWQWGTVLASSNGSVTHDILLDCGDLVNLCLAFVETRLGARVRDTRRDGADALVLVSPLPVVPYLLPPIPPPQRMQLSELAFMRDETGRKRARSEITLAGLVAFRRAAALDQNSPAAGEPATLKPEWFSWTMPMGRSVHAGASADTSQAGDKSTLPRGQIAHDRFASVGEELGKGGAGLSHTRSASPNGHGRKEKETVLRLISRAEVRARERQSSFRANTVRCACGLPDRTESLLECRWCTSLCHRFCCQVPKPDPSARISSTGEATSEPEPFECFVCAPDLAVPGSLAARVAEAASQARRRPEWRFIKRAIEMSADADEAFDARRFDSDEAWDGAASPGRERANGRQVQAKGKRGSGRKGMGGYRGRDAADESGDFRVLGDASAARAANGAGGLQPAGKGRKETAEERQFLAAWRAFWRARGRDYTVLPTFRGPPLDLYIMYTAVRDLGGMEIVRREKLFKKVWLRMRNYYPAATDFSFKLKQMYAVLLQPYVDEGPPDDQVFGTTSSPTPTSSPLHHGLHIDSVSPPHLSTN